MIRFRDAGDTVHALDDLLTAGNDWDWTVPGLLNAQAVLNPHAPALWQRSPEGRWQSSSWGEYRNACAAVAAGLRKRGLNPGDRVGIMAASSKEWDYAQIGILAAGGVAIGLDPHAIDEHTQAIAQQCGLVGVVLGSPAFLDKLGNVVRERLRFIIFIDPGDDPIAIRLSTLMTETTFDEPWNVSWNSAKPDAAATIIFTSGTTGEPKGVEYSHRQMCLATASILSAFPDITEGSRLACWLPLSNLFQRMINLCAIGRCAQTFYVADPREIMRIVPEIAPHVFVGVPRFYEKLYSGIQDAIAKKAPWQQAIARWALRIGDWNAAALRAGQATPPARTLVCLVRRLQMALAELLVLKKLRHALGTNLRFMISGSAPMPAWLLERFHAIGLPILEAYGISENIIPVSLNRPDDYRFGTVGRPLPGCEVRLADDGELLVRGPGVFKAYLGEDTGEARVDANGFLLSGDFATIDDDGFITLIGRKSEIFKTSTGRRVAPARIESLLRQIAGVEFAAVFGAGRTVPTALLAITEAGWQDKHDQLPARLREQALHAMEPLPPYLRPTGFALTTRMPTIAGGELTANLKMRRRVIEISYATILNELHRRLDEAAGAPFDAHSKDGLTLFIGL